MQKGLDLVFWLSLSKHFPRIEVLSTKMIKGWTDSGLAARGARAALHVNLAVAVVSTAARVPTAVLAATSELRAEAG